MGEGLNIPDHFSDLPLCILGPSTRRLLSIHLDPPAVIPTPRGVLGDLSGLAELAGFEFCHIRYFETKQSRTMACLEEWGSRQSGTVGNLIKNLTTMERFDCLSEIRDLILRDITNHVQRQSHRNEKKLNIENPDSENNLVKNIFSIDLNSNQNVVDENALHFSSIKPSNVVTEPISTDSGYIDGTEHFNISLIDSNPKSKGVTNEIIQLRRVKSKNDCLERDSSVNNQVPFHVHRSISPIYEDEDDAFLTTDDKEGDPKKYTACICCADENIELANIIIHKYKTEHDADFFLPQEALLSGRYEFETLAEVIETRCDSRVIVILSKHYITSPACVFATQFVKTLDPDAKRRKIIPVLLDEDVIYPRVLRGISSIKARRLKYGNSFWNLLSSSLRLPKIVDEENNLMTHKCPNRLIINKAGETKEGKNKETEINSCYNCHTSSSSSVRTRTNTIMDNVVLNSKTDASSISNASSDSGVSVGATGTNLFEDSNSTAGNVKRKNPGLRTLRRIMKSLNIIERKPKLQFTKRSHSTGETMESSPAQVFVEPRSHSTTVPPMIAPDVNRAGDSPDCRYVFNICHTESELTLTNYPASLSASSSKNNFSTNNNGKPLDESLPTTSNSMNIYVKEETGKHLNTRQNILSPNIDAENTGQNILSPNIDTVSSKLALSSNNIDLPSRQISCDNNISPSSRTASFDNASLLSEITSSDNNSIRAPSRKTSFDNFSLASSFRQMNSGSNSNSRQTSFDSNSRQTSFDGNSLTSVEDNTAADKPILKSCWNDKEANISGRKKSEVMFEIML